MAHSGRNVTSAVCSGQPLSVPMRRTAPLNRKQKCLMLKRTSILLQTLGSLHLGWHPWSALEGHRPAGGQHAFPNTSRHKGFQEAFVSLKTHAKILVSCVCISTYITLLQQSQENPRGQAFKKAIGHFSMANKNTQAETTVIKGTSLS